MSMGEDMYKEEGEIQKETGSALFEKRGALCPYPQSANALFSTAGQLA